MLKVVLGVVALAFGALSLWALKVEGYWGLFAGQLNSLGGVQVLGDLVISCGLLMFFIWRDARKSGRNPWPYAVLALVAGSFGALAYLLLRPAAARRVTHDRPVEAA